MKTSEFQYNLPEELIAQQPCDVRSQSRLLHYSRNTTNTQHLRFSDIVDLIRPEDCLIFNNTRVIPARLHGEKESGGKIEVLVERVINNKQCLAQVRASKTPKAGSFLKVSHPDNSDIAKLKVIGREASFFLLESADNNDISSLIESYGHMPLPPYINREDNNDDYSRYQTVYAKEPGAVAAPTAGLHFDEPLLEKLTAKGVKFGYVTLHVGAGTFQPVRSESIEQHKMHSEYVQVPDETVELCRQTREQGGRIIAVGTTSVRSLESASQQGMLQTYQGDTDIFIYPGYAFVSVDAMITNFHLPESTLLMLISAFASKEEMLDCYKQAVEEKYRFFSYGDAMFIE